MQKFLKYMKFLNWQEKKWRTGINYKFKEIKMVVKTSSYKKNKNKKTSKWFYGVVYPPFEEQFILLLQFIHKLEKEQKIPTSF